MRLRHGGALIKTAADTLPLTREETRTAISDAAPATDGE